MAVVWIESHQSLLTHRKTARLARALSVPKIQVIGHLHALWWWAVDNAPSGELGAMEPADVADGACWEGGATEFLDALLYAGFVDRDEAGTRIHEWPEYTGRLIERREANAERMRRARAEHAPSINGERAAHVPRTSGARAGATGPNSTGPNSTGPDRTGEGAPNGAVRTADAAAPPPTPRMLKPKGISFQPLVDAFKAAGLPEPQFVGSEIQAAQWLVKRHPPELIVQCWQDFASGEFPPHSDGWEQDKLSFGLLQREQRFAKWLRWHEAQTTEASEPRCTNCQVTFQPSAGQTRCVYCDKAGWFAAIRAAKAREVS
jgi:hypothetical protein